MIIFSVKFNKFTDIGAKKLSAALKNCTGMKSLEWVFVLNNEQLFSFFVQTVWCGLMGQVLAFVVLYNICKIIFFIPCQEVTFSLLTGKHFYIIFLIVKLFVKQLGKQQTG